MALQKIQTTAKASGNGWSATKSWGWVVVVFNAPTETVTLPSEFRPTENINMSIVTSDARAGRAIINASNGVVTPFVTGNFYGTATYLSS